MQIRGRSPPRSVARRRMNSQTARSGGRELNSWPPRVRMRRTAVVVPGPAPFSPLAVSAPIRSRRRDRGGQRLGRRRGGPAPAFAEVGGGVLHLHPPLPRDAEPIPTRLRTRGDDVAQLFA